MSDLILTSYLEGGQLKIKIVKDAQKVWELLQELDLHQRVRLVEHLFDS